MQSPPLTVIDLPLLDRVSLQARQSPRLRKNHNFHPSDEFCSHRLLNGMEPGSYIRPHRHLDPTKDESILVVRGSVGFIGFDDAGNVTITSMLAAGGEAIGVDIPHGSYHTLISLTSGSIFFEAKAGPYRPLNNEEVAAWAPAEGDKSVSAYLASLERLFR
jgi:cupin fold WbuC family metalloprotein